MEPGRYILVEGIKHHVIEVFKTENNLWWRYIDSHITLPTSTLDKRICIRINDEPKPREHHMKSYTFHKTW